MFLRACVLLAVLCLQWQLNAQHLSRSTIEKAVQEAISRVDSAYEYSRQECLNRIRRNGARAEDVLRFLKHPTGVTREVARSADYMDTALNIIKRSAERRQRRSINATDLLSEEDLEFISELTGCSPRQRVPSCKTTPNLNVFRTASGVCNNEHNPRWGASNTPFARWLPAEYQDGISLPRGWDPIRINGFFLPLVRDVSNRLLATAINEVVNDNVYSHLLPVFGQWTDHDQTLAPITPVIRSFSNGIDCDETCERTEPCFPILIPKDDPRFGTQECIPFFRSTATCGSGNTGFIFGAATVRQQLNALTAFLDASQVYGSEEEEALELRDLTTDEGLLRVNEQFTDKGRELLPFTKAMANICATRARITNDKNAEEVLCFFAGDERSTENILLTSLHTLFLREHNRLARALAKLNPEWNGERIYQETRKIVGGYLQVITFRDYLGAIVGPEVVAKKLSTYPGYDKFIDPSIANVFGTAAYRYGHSMIQPFAFRLNAAYEDHPLYPSPLLHTALNTPWRVVFEGGIDPILRGLVGRPAKLNVQDAIMTDELRDMLFKFSFEMALDLGSLNMQRAREHGIPGYNQWRKFCGLSQPQNEEELADVLKNKDLARRFLDLYGTPENIDVFMGGIAEPLVKGGRVGELFACLIGIQFSNIRAGDRFWWENEGVFTKSQRASLMTTSLSRIICDNTGITEIPDKPFLFRPRGNGYADCRDIPEFDLTPWTDTPYGFYDPMTPTAKPTQAPWSGWQPWQGMSRPYAGPPGPPGPAGPPGPPGSYGSTNQKVAFSVRLSDNFPRPGVPIPFRDIIYNGQRSYDTETGVFTCTYPGVYEFQFYCTIYERSASVDLMRNGEMVLHSFTTRQEGYISASGSTYIKLARGDRIWLVANYGGNGMTKDSYFSGHMLFTEE
ncbi:eosinophil peroxidase-like [Syngnathoides biaculeatus]|uniref:eosinophil peroxidase-like n=1 Tax=Syngnathoides biaculeatus TaxID=300417 RepID=UPI002ADDB5D6|nr:eosinophil peroxidase-like [Syngnathoides biaculeatus]XP_061672535.1 eosinophil peroxidase-like [Syngnathoides biaculeatus]XP_061672536.1 eosinophil peroxidase-like [Syngnathoides biaculeatus]